MPCDDCQYRGRCGGQHSTLMDAIIDFFTILWIVLGWVVAILLIPVKYVYRRYRRRQQEEVPDVWREGY